jgi:hypothetical protein
VPCGVPNLWREGLRGCSTARPSAVHPELQMRRAGGEAIQMWLAIDPRRIEAREAGAVSNLTLAAGMPVVIDAVVA